MILNENADFGFVPDSSLLALLVGTPKVKVALTESFLGKPKEKPVLEEPVFKTEPPKFTAGDDAIPEGSESVSPSFIVPQAGHFLTDSSLRTKQPLHSQEPAFGLNNSLKVGCFNIDVDDVTVQTELIDDEVADGNSLIIVAFGEQHAEHSLSPNLLMM